jgi:hypothetical protein
VGRRDGWPRTAEYWRVRLRRAAALPEDAQNCGFLSISAGLGVIGKEDFLAAALRRSVMDPESAERTFCRRQARRLLAYAESCREKRVAGTLLHAAEYFLDRVEPPQPRLPTERGRFEQRNGGPA